jgi:hypothetical protein
MTRRHYYILLLLAVVTALVLILGSRYQSAPLVKGDAAPRVLSQPPLVQNKPLIGESILARYGEASQSPQDDIMWMARSMENFAVLVKGDNPLPLGANEDIANALRGKNRAHLRFLPDTHPAFNAKGQLVDRWGTPLFFHTNDHSRIDIRSAGPDKIMWTADDLHRRYDGRFLKGDELLAPSLFETTSKQH